MNIIARDREQQELRSVIDSDEPAFLVIYGRRRVGKTYLIKNYFKDKGLFFHVTGIQNGSLEMQLRTFCIEFSDSFRKGKDVSIPQDWVSAFEMLRKEMEGLSKNLKKIIFLDELPWLATPRSMLLQALEHVWNRYLSNIPNLVLIVCGSAASWMIKNVLNNKGGLYGRVTKQIKLAPFTLSQTEQYLKSKHISLERKQILELYMCLGGVAKYLTYIERGKSSAQIISSLCFSYNAPLISEFHNLYRSLFDHHEDHEKIVRALAKTRSGLSYKELVEQTHFSTGGTLSKRIEELVQAGFVAEIPLFGKGKKNLKYLLIDEFSLFYLTWNSGVSAIDLQSRESDYWIKKRNTQPWKIWTGHAYEAICLKHIDRIKFGLGLSAVQTMTSKWRYSSPKGSKEQGTEVDIVIDRADQCINLCEVKFYDGKVSIDKKYASTLREKKACFDTTTGTRKSTFTTLITTYGATHNQHFLRSVDQELSMDVLFDT
jgi:uncharacterized protein